MATTIVPHIVGSRLHTESKLLVSSLVLQVEVHLQVDTGAGEVLAAPRLKETLGNPVDFFETARLVTTLDLVITIDSSVAHLAGALGQAVWVLLPCAPDWRWMLGRDDSPWYPSATLFRQSEPGDWSGPIREISRKITGLSESK